VPLGIIFSAVLIDAVIGFFVLRDRTPFVLTSDMAYVINGGDKPTAKFHHFVDLCCNAFNIVRRHGNLLLNLFCLVRAEITFR
jgi:phosphatidylinositol-4-phosphate 3-kinase